MSNIDIAEQPIGEVIQERVEAHLATIAKHYQDPNVAAKKSSITLTITLTPDVRKKMLLYTVADKVTLPTSAPYQNTMYIGVDKGGEPFAQQHDPDQYILSFDDRRTPA